MSQTLCPPASLPPASISSAGQLAAILLAALAAGCVLAWRARQVRGTTLSAVTVWGAVSLVALAGIELTVRLADTPTWTAAARYTAAMSTFCPIVALLGAKRPQDAGWQWIVLSLWAILCQPAAEWLLFGGVAEIHPARFWFLVLLIAVGATNGIGTRGWLASSLFAAAQWVLMLPYFSTESLGWAPACAVVGLLLAVASWCKTTRVAARRVQAQGLDVAWRDFRDAFGVVWALRIQERMNTSSRMYDWPVQLGWHGFVPRESSAYTELPQVVEDSFRTLLRRFVSPAWIDARVGTSPAIPQPAETPAAS